MGIQVIKGGSSAYLKLAGDVALSSSLVSVVDQTNTVSGLQLATASIGLTMPTFLALPNWTVTLGIKDGFSSQQTVAVASLGTGVFRLIANKYTINNTAAQTGSVTGYFLNATETALNGITHNLIDLQVGGVSKFNVSRLGSITVAGGNSSFGGGVAIGNGADYLGWAGGRLLMYSPSVGMLALNGTTNAFPAIKRNGAAIDFRLADDSNYCTISALNIYSNGFLNAGNMYIGSGSYIYNSATSNTRLNSFTNGYSIELNATTAISASSIFTLNSTTQGFLMPRMTTAQINAIATPANGLQVYNTTLNQPCFYDGAIWNKLNHSPM